ncbi:MAG: AraC family transcriptional regulator [Rhodocyclaceae bacterium]|nr:AraC family transcriptional regulator [Rhodocyclaceae bacterium]
MATHSILSISHIANGLAANGVPIAPVLEKHGLAFHQLAPGSRISYAKELQIFCELCDQVRDPLELLRIGMSQGLTGYGAYGMLLLSCATPYEAIQCAMRFPALTYLFGQLGFTPKADHSELTIQPVELPPWPYRLRTDYEVAGSIRLIHDLVKVLGFDVRPLRISMPYPEPAESAAYVKLFGCPVTFGDSLVRIHLENGPISAPLKESDRVANAMHLAQCEQLHALAMREEDADIAQQMRTHLKLHRGEFPTAAEVARAFGRSERSLFNDLQKHKVSYRKMLDEVRFDQARELLEQSTISVDQIALQMGYTETTSFIRAFQRWCGNSPARFRKLARAQTA